MSRTKKIILTFLAYLASFIVSVCVSSFVLNSGTVSGELQQTKASLPVLYVKTGDAWLYRAGGCWLLP